MSFMYKVRDQKPGELCAFTNDIDPQLHRALVQGVLNEVLKTTDNNDIFVDVEVTVRKYKCYSTKNPEPSEDTKE